MDIYENYATSYLMYTLKIVLKIRCIINKMSVARRLLDVKHETGSNEITSQPSTLRIEISLYFLSILTCTSTSCALW